MNNNKLTQNDYNQYLILQTAYILTLEEFNNILNLGGSNYNNLRNIILNMYNADSFKDRHVDILKAQLNHKIELEKILNISIENWNSNLFSEKIIPIILNKY